MQMGGTNGVETRSTISELHATARRIRVPVSLLSNSFSDGGIGEAVGFNVVSTRNVRYGKVERTG
jgi:hypothetical protein